MYERKLVMQKSALFAPEKYNIISEIEKYSHIPDKKAILYHNTEGEDISKSLTNSSLNSLIK